MMRKILSLLVCCVALISAVALLNCSESPPPPKQENPQFAGFTPKSPKARRYVVILGKGDNALEMPLILDESKPGQRSPDGREEIETYDTLLADKNLDGRIEAAESLDRIRIDDAHYDAKMRVLAPAGPDGKEVRCDLRILVSCSTFLYGFNVWSTIHLDDEKTTWSYIILADPRSPRRRDPKDNRLSRFFFGTPLKLTLKADLKDGELQVATGLEDEDKGDVLVQRDGKTVCPHLKITGPSGEEIVSKDLEPG